MSTRGVIARKIDAGWRGRYHHFDSYPSGLGKGLWDLYHGHFGRDLDKMLGVLLDEHEHWSNIIGADFNLEPGYGARDGRPACYCHGERDEEGGWIYSDGDDWGAFYAYVLTEKGMEVYGRDGSRWALQDVFDWDGKEPDWSG